MKFITSSFIKVIIVTLLATNLVHAAEFCQALFNDKPQITNLSYSFLPNQTSLAIFKAGQTSHLIRESVVTIHDVKKMRKDELPIDQTLSGMVIDAGLETGRKLFEDVLNFKTESKEAIGVFIFVDVNNLGWINNHFFNKKKSGDHYIQSVSKALLKVIGKNGLLFRLGGDEFGIVMPASDPSEIKSFMQQLIIELQTEAHALFQFESKTRAENLKVLSKYYKMGMVDKKTYQDEVDLFKQYATYSQEGLSIGGSFIDGRGVSSIIKEAEEHAVKMKLAVKSAQHQDISKYTEQKIVYQGSPQLSFQYDFPLLNLVNRVFVTADKNFVDSEQLPAVIKTRDRVEKKLGPIRIVKYLSEDGLAETRIEYYPDVHSSPTTPARYIKSEIVDIHSHTGFIDAKSVQAQELIKFFLQEYNEERGVVWLNLLNLGKLNYFENKTQTGDKMIKKFSILIRDSLRTSDIPFKSQGSEFLILIDQTGPLKLEKMRERLFNLINNDPEIRQIYDEQIQYLKNQLTRADTSEKTIQIRRKISETLALRNQPKLVVKALSLSVTQKMSEPELIEKLKDIK